MSQATGRPAGNVGDHVEELRRNGQLLGVHVAEPIPHYRFPSWQFAGDGQPVTHLAEILAIMREYGLRLDKQERTSGWGEVEWFLSGHALLGGDAPCDMLGKDPEAVLEAARVEFLEVSRSGGF